MGKLISFWSVRHRTGTSLTALNYATKLSEVLDVNILVIDTNCFSDMCNFLDVRYSTTIDDLLTVIKYDTSCSLKDIKKSSVELRPNLDLLPGTAIPSIDYITSNYEAYYNLIKLCRNIYDIVILDLNAGIQNKLTLSLLDESDIIYNILEQDNMVLSDYVNKASSVVSEFSNKVVNIVNKFDEYVLPNIEEIANIISSKNLYALSYCPSLRTALNSKTLSKYIDDKTDYNKDLQIIIDAAIENHFVDFNKKSPAKKSLLGKLFGK